MGSSGTVKLKEVWAMLEECAPGYNKRATDHNWRVTYGERTYPALPLGPHGRRENPEIELGHIRQMVRFLGISECAKTHISQL